MLWEEQALRERGLDGDGKRLPALCRRKAQAKEARAGSPSSDDTGDFAPWLSLVGGLCGCWRTVARSRCHKEEPACWVPACSCLPRKRKLPGSGIAAPMPRCLRLQTRTSLRISTRKIQDKRNRACCGFQPFDISPRSAANLVGFAEHHCRRDGRAGPWFSFRKFDIRRELGSFVRSVAHECLTATVPTRRLPSQMSKNVFRSVLSIRFVAGPSSGRPQTVLVDMHRSSRACASCPSPISAPAGRSAGTHVQRGMA
jgi:hypothetical protein